MIPQTLVQRLPDISGSETKIVIAICSIIENGQQVTMDAVRERTGLSKTTMYRCWDSDVIKSALKYSRETDNEQNLSEHLRKLADELEQEAYVS